MLTDKSDNFAKSTGSPSLAVRWTAANGAAQAVKVTNGTMEATNEVSRLAWESLADSAPPLEDVVVVGKGSSPAHSLSVSSTDTY